MGSTPPPTSSRLVGILDTCDMPSSPNGKISFLNDLIHEASGRISDILKAKAEKKAAQD